MRITPLHDQVLVERAAATDVTSGGIIIPDAAKERPAQGVVLATGPGRREIGMLIPPSVREGERVLFRKNAGIEVDGADGRKLTILRESDILATLDEVH